MDEAKSDVGSSGDEVLDDTLGETGGPLSDGAMERKRLLAPEQTTNALSPFLLSSANLLRLALWASRS